MTRRTGNSNRLNSNSNENVTFDKHHTIPKEACTDLTPESKKSWNSAPTKEKDSFLGSARDNHKPKSPFNRKENKS